ncbi:hypothetical protein B0A50_07503 [Salinomyces thailandicus]|uniref:Uncharacterized protein n=1 Tax=Salinomyces thailandicus TaxID=706561 RepID=A0A4U0TNS4_9PEZI|nr:hypothetical protein B0A50_07503 [Salinomyces thailandica]
MKPTTLVSSVLALAAAANATILVDPVAPTLYAGDEQEVVWTMDQKYTVEVDFVQQTSYGWKTIKQLLDRQKEPTGRYRFDWTVPRRYAGNGKKYAFWVSGSQGSGGYANLTNWFEISDGCGKREGSAKLFLA